MGGDRSLEQRQALIQGVILQPVAEAVEHIVRDNARPVGMELVFVDVGDTRRKPDRRDALSRKRSQEQGGKDMGG